MANPYESPNKSAQPATAVPYWYALFCQLYWPTWWLGTALIVGSWINVVPPKVGWIGFGMACAASFGSYVLPSLAGVKAADYVVLDSRLLKSKGEVYADVMDRFCAGATLMFDGAAFSFRPENQITCGIVAPAPNINEAEAGEVADHAQSVYDTLNESSPEFAAAVAGQTFRISILSSMDADAEELYCVEDGNIEVIE